MTLDDWRIRQGLSVQQLANRIRTTHQSALRYCNGQRVPRAAIMPRIYRITGGAVQPNDFYRLPRLRRRDMNGGAP